MDTTTCPECGAPAEVTNRSALESTDGPVEHVKLQCVRRHWFLMPTFLLAEYVRPPARTRPAPRRPVRVPGQVTRSTPGNDAA
jgi:hypothetical protein